MNPEALQKIGYGMYVVCSKKDSKFNGQIANTVFQVASKPPMVAVSINKRNLTHEFIRESRVFTASVLCEDTPLSFVGLFGFKSGRDTDKFQNVSYKLGVTGAPVVIDNATAFLEVRVTQEMDVGSHTVFVGEVVEAEVLMDAACMTYEYYHKMKGGKAPPAAPTHIVEERRTPALASYKCNICGWVYDPAKGDADGGIQPGVPFEELPDTWVCPVCGADKSQFEKVT